MLVVEELGRVVEVVDVVEVVEVVEVVVVTRSVTGGDSADIESTVSVDGAVVEELVVELGTVVVELGAVESVGASSIIGNSTHVCEGSNSLVALTGATGNDATIAANTATKHAMRLCERARKNPLVPSTPRIRRT